MKNKVVGGLQLGDKEEVCINDITLSYMGGHGVPLIRSVPQRGALTYQKFFDF